MSTIGNVVSRHRKNATLSLIVIAFGILVAGVGALLLSVKGAAKPEARELIGLVALVATLLGLGLVALGWVLRRGGSFTIGENGIRVMSSGGARELGYRDMAESCQMYRSGVSVGIAVRAEGQSEWIAVSAQLGDYAHFRQGLIERYIAARTPLLLEQLGRGQTLRFKMANLDGKLQGAMVTGIAGYVRVATDDALLTQRTLSVAGRTIDIQAIRKIDYANWTENLVLQMADGSSEKVKLTALFDGELLLALVERLAPALAAQG